MEKRKLTKAQEAQLLEVAKRLMSEVDARGIKKALEEAYLLGKGK